MIIVGRRGDESSYCGDVFLLINVRDAAVRDLEGALSLRHVGRVVDLGDALLAAALLEVDATSGRRVTGTARYSGVCVCYLPRAAGAACVARSRRALAWCAAAWRARVGGLRCRKHFFAEHIIFPSDGGQ